MKRPSRSMRRCAGVASLMLALLAGGCGFEGLWEKPALTLDPREVFPISVTGGDFGDAGPCEGWEGAERVRLGSLFDAALPPDGQWDVVEAHQATLLVHRRGGPSTWPSAFVYAEEATMGALGLELLFFHARVDRRKAIELLEWGARLVGEVVEASQTPPPTDDQPQAEPQEEPPPSPVVTAETLEATVKILSTVIAAVAPGYSSEEGSFSGWRWLGTCGASLLVRSQSSNDGSVAMAMQPFLRLSNSRGGWRLQTGGIAVPAFMILATATIPERPEQGIHLVIVCSESPRCTEAPDLARLLGSIRVAPTKAPTPDHKLGELASEVGVTVW